MRKRPEIKRAATDRPALIPMCVPGKGGLFLQGKNDMQNGEAMVFFVRLDGGARLS
jgi:hypothetical protein